MYGVELDSVSGRIAQQLYQKNKIAVQGFETMQFPDSFFDCVVGNVPFGNYKVPDKRYDRHNFLIHDYFIAKSLDLVRPGGVVAVVTSSGTMDKKDSSVREYLANRADLVGAIRLPNNAFQRNANTSVVADILFLQKRDRAAVERAEWVDLGTTPEEYPINQYFAQHPEMVLGEITTESTQYGKQETTVKPIEGADLAQQLKAAVENIHAEITEPEITDDELDQNAEPLPADPNVKNFSYTNVDGQVYYRENSYMNKVDLPAVTAERVLGMIALRETTQKLLDCQLHDGTDAEVELLQGKLKDQYKRFTAQYGLINSTANKRAFRQDSSYCLLASLEILDEDKNLKRLADIFTKRTIRKPEPVTSVDTPSEALALSIGEKAKVDVPFMAELCGKTEQEVTEELAGIIFRNPVTQAWVTADEYLSGNVREKLATAETFAANHPEYQVNVEYLKRVQPKDLNASEIEVRLGANWIKAEYITDFMERVFKTPSYYIGSSIKATYSEISGAWNISGKSLDRSNPRVTNTYGTMRVNGYRLLEDALNYLHVELLLNSVERCIAIRPCDKNNPNAIRWGRLKEGRWCASTLGCRGLAKTLFDIMEWDEDLRYRFRGQFLEQGDNKMMLFAFDEPEMIKVEEIVLPPKENTEEDEGETVKKKIYIFPPEWAGTFGQPITSIAQVGILRQEHYAGNWDVFRPATEIEEMNIFTAESLNELLREAEKIMEGWTDYR